jgi:predicted flap endonuclease-1-like 5' DNA nuclease
MFYLIWQMGFVLLISFALGLFFGRQIWSGDARSAEADQALADAARLRQENENLARRLGEAEARAEQPQAEAEESIKTGAAAMPAAETKPKPKAKPAAKKAATKAAKPVEKSVDNPVEKSVDKPVEKAPASAGQDDLTRIKGLGPKAAAALADGGVTSFAQIAAWSDADIASWDEKINGRGRITRDDWVGQAKTLA